MVKKSCRKLGFRLNDDEDLDWDIYWSDTGFNPAMVQKMLPFQRMNHYAGMYCISHKNHLAKNLKRMHRHFPSEYEFSPKSWILPYELSDFKNQFTKKKAKTFIVKPVACCQGKGIFLTRNYEDIKIRSNEQLIVQRYLHKPYLIDNLKFDLRIYVFLYGVDPLRVFVHREGLARFATEEYTGPFNNNLDNLYMHLTNYAINKFSENFEANEDEDDDETGHKRSVTAVLKHIEDTEKNPNITAEKLWAKIDDICVKTIISG